MKNSYLRFFLMIATSVVAMYAASYLNSWDISHVWFSQSRVFMVLYMGAVMAVIMLAYMLGMYKSRVGNTAVVVLAVLVFAGSLWLMRSQTTVDDVAYMKAMIPHHSIAILTSRRAQISDPRVRELADGIIEAQEREIAEMERLIGDLQAR
ncbi:MAG: DUF305 domain-containing protein [Flavobacteriaceae bacterium]